MGQKTDQQATLKKKQAVTDELRKEVTAINEDILNVQRRLSQKENEIEHEKTDRFNLLRNCKLDNIKVPLLAGSLNQLIEARNTEENTQNTENSEMMDDTMDSETTSQMTSTTMARTSLVQQNQT